MSLVLSLLLRPVPLRGINGPRAFFCVRSAGRVRPSDHPRKAMLFAVFLRVAVVLSGRGPS